MTYQETALDTIHVLYGTEFLKDIAEGGVEGNAPDLCNPEETIPFFDKFEDEIINYLKDTSGEKILIEIQKSKGNDLNGYKHDLVFAYIETVAKNFVDGGLIFNGIKMDGKTLPITEDAFGIALQALDIYFWRQNFDPSKALLYKSSDLIKEITNPSQGMTKATYLTLWEAASCVNPEVVDELGTAMWQLVFGVKESCLTVEDLKERIESQMNDAEYWDKEDEFSNEMESVWEIGDSDSCSYSDKESFLKEVQWDFIHQIVDRAWNYSLSVDAMKDLRAYKEDFE